MNPFLYVEDGRDVGGGESLDSDGGVLRPDPDVAVRVVKRRPGLRESDWNPPLVVVPVVLLGRGCQVSFLEWNETSIKQRAKITKASNNPLTLTILEFP